MTLLIWAVALVVSAIFGYYLTKLVLRLAQRKAVAEDSTRASHTKPGEPAETQPHTSDLPATSSESAPEHSTSTSPAGGPQAATEGPDGSAARAALRGGMWIGVLERLLITGFIMSGQFAGVAVVIAIKGLGRYPELNAHTSERFIIGTLASLLWACACGWLGLYAISRFA